MPDQLKPPIFLLGNVRSGTTMIHDLFDRHEQVRSWLEPRTVWVFADPGRRHDQFDESDATEGVKRYIRKRFLRYQQRHGNLRIMEKTPSNMMRIPYVHAIFPEARFVYIIREPLANLSSSEYRWRMVINLPHLWNRFLEVPKSQLHHYAARFVTDNFRKKILRQPYVSVYGVRYPGIYEDIRQMTVAEVIAKQWVICSRQAEEDIPKLPPGTVIRIRYEDFVRDPVDSFRNLCEHFDLPLTGDLEKHIRDTVDPGRQTKWRRLDPEVVTRCLPILVDEMKRHGYEVPEDLQNPEGTGGGPPGERAPAGTRETDPAAAGAGRDSGTD